MSRSPVITSLLSFTHSVAVVCTVNDDFPPLPHTSHPRPTTDCITYSRWIHCLVGQQNQTGLKKCESMNFSYFTVPTHISLYLQSALSYWQFKPLQGTIWQKDFKSLISVHWHLAYCAEADSCGHSEVQRQIIWTLQTHMNKPLAEGLGTI